nr:MAG TPA: major capsid protein [Caudoviricetes sp.]
MATKPLIPVGAAATAVNSLAKQYIGTEALLADDLSNISDFGRAFEDLDSGTKEIVKSGLVTLITEQLAIAKEYKGNEVDIIRSRGAYDPSAGIIQKNRPNLLQAEDDGDVYNPDVNSTSDPFKNNPINFETEYFYKPFQFRYQWSIPERWMTGMFLSRDKFNQFIAAVDTSVKNSLTLNIDNITLSTLRASIALNLNGGESPRAINLLKSYNKAFKATLKAEQALQTPEFLRWCLNQISVTLDQLKIYSSLYNEKAYPNHLADPNVVFLSQFENAAKQYLQADVFNKDLLELPGHSTVVSWKGLVDAKGAVPSFKSLSTVKDTFSVSWQQTPITVNQEGVVAHIFDNERVGIYNLGMKTTSMADPVGLKTNYWTHVFCSAITDPYENGVTFYIKDEA